MSETKWTPGPWEVGKHPAISGAIVKPILFGGRVRVLPECEGGHVILRNEANAHLIAAAPELYAALVETLAIAERNETGDFAAKARAALAKARGETP